MFSFGSVSHGTMQPRDVAESILSTFATFAHGQWASDVLTWENIHDCALIARGSDTQARRDAVENWPDIFDSICDDINGSADMPPFAYFGTHEGDGSDLGVWPDHDALENGVHCGEVIKISDLADIDSIAIADLPDQLEFFLLVNDHGNCTLYPARVAHGESVWAIV